MPSSTLPPDSSKNKTSAKKPSDKPSSSSCPSPSKTSTNFQANSTKSKEDMFTPPPNPSSNSSSSSRACSNKSETTFSRTEKDTSQVSSSWKKLLNKSQSLRKKSGSRVLRLKKRKLKPISSLQKLRLKRKKCKSKTIRLKSKPTSVVLSRRMCNQRKPSLKKNLRLQAHWSSKPKKPWTQLKRRTSKSPNHSPIHQEVSQKCSQLPSGSCQDSSSKLTLIQKPKSQNNSIGKLPKSSWRIQTLSWPPCLDSRKSLILMKSPLPTWLKSRRLIFQTQVSTQLSSSQNQRPLLVCVHGCLT